VLNDIYDYINVGVEMKHIPVLMFAMVVALTACGGKTEPDYKSCVTVSGKTSCCSTNCNSSGKSCTTTCN